MSIVSKFYFFHEFMGTLAKKKHKCFKKNRKNLTNKVTIDLKKSLKVRAFKITVEFFFSFLNSY